LANDKSTMKKIMETYRAARSHGGRCSALNASLYCARNDALDLAAKILRLFGAAARQDVRGGP
jgi:hypothetical protein